MHVIVKEIFPLVNDLIFGLAYSYSLADDFVKGEGLPYIVLVFVRSMMMTTTTTI